jgi:hypothetical protein
MHITVLFAEDNIAVEVTTYPESPVVNNTWTLSLIVDYPFPDDVSVIEPQFNTRFFLERIIKYSKTLGTKVQTVFEYSFTLSVSGIFRIEPFTVVCQDSITKTIPFNLYVRPVNEKQALPVLRLSWEINPEQNLFLSAADSYKMTAGEHAFLILRINNLNSLSEPEYPPQEFFSPEVPQGAILALSPLSTEERTEGIMLKLKLIPLKGDFRISAKTLQHGNFIFEVPPLFIRVNELAEKADVTEHIADTEKAGSSETNIQEISQYSGLPASVSIQKITAYNTSRKYYFALIYSAIILVILTPIVCFLLFKNEKK